MRLSSRLLAELNAAPVPVSTGALAAAAGACRGAVKSQLFRMERAGLAVRGGPGRWWSAKWFPGHARGATVDVTDQSGAPVAPKAYSIGAVAKIAQVAPRTAVQWFDRGLLKGYRIPGSKDRRVYEPDLVAFLLEHGLWVPPDALARVRGGSA